MTDMDVETVFDNEPEAHKTIGGEVVCASCEARFPAFDMAPSQAPGCAAVVYADGYIQGFYGSGTIDTELWQFVGARPEWVVNGDICDACVQRLIDEGRIEISEWGLW